MRLINDHFQNYKRYQIPKAQLVIADIPYNVGTKAYGFEIKKDFCKAFHEKIEPLGAQDRMAV